MMMSSARLNMLVVQRGCNPQALWKRAHARLKFPPTRNSSHTPGPSGVANMSHGQQSEDVDEQQDSSTETSNASVVPHTTWRLLYTDMPQDPEPLASGTTTTHCSRSRTGNWSSCQRNCRGAPGHFPFALDSDPDCPFGAPRRSYQFRHGSPDPPGHYLL